VRSDGVTGVRSLEVFAAGRPVKCADERRVLLAPPAGSKHHAPVVGAPSAAGAASSGAVVHAVLQWTGFRPTAAERLIAHFAHSEDALTALFHELDPADSGRLPRARARTHARTHARTRAHAHSRTRGHAPAGCRARRSRAGCGGSARRCCPQARVRARARTRVRA
jgi:hypothetical protein